MLNISEITILMFVQEIQDKLNTPAFEKVFNLPECERSFIQLIKGVPVFQLNTLRDDIRAASDIIVRYNKMLYDKYNWETNIVLLASLQFVVSQNSHNKHLTMRDITSKLGDFHYISILIFVSIQSVINANRVPEKDPHSL